MNMDSLTNNRLARLTGRTSALLSHALDFRSANHAVISENLANIDTPGYRYKELHFKKELQNAMQKTALQPTTTNPKHFSQLNEGHPFTIQTKSDRLNIDKEMAKMVQNNLLYDATVKLLAKKFESLKATIEAGRR